ncbi:MAG: cation:proton antiporter [Methanocalculus sp. MSAO_Arc1]|uniref:cation:proton antiporter n=1 Tax=Methanocalculus TaxID=71151 RepID=UPI000FF5A227|nr:MULTISPECIES: cation:proton antiporter [unclassified Methanocalculus]MCP1662684.1 multicomponent Na+:H+ antiporter subunit F [Methanocalculus sp. AMF5]RQD80286.1 MAG: cation:proton antiporter [Methanocalculus sp. MSAO_Arc1]
MYDIFYASMIILILTVFLCLYRVLAGPGVENRLIAVNTIGTKTIVLLVLIGFIYERPIFLDIAIIYAMINFIATIAIAKYLKRGCLC